MNKYTKENLSPVVESCYTWSDVCRHFGIKPLTGSQAHIKRRAIDFGIDFSHFLGQGSTKGKIRGPKRPIEDYLFNLCKIDSHSLKLRLVKEGIKKYECERCKTSEWDGEELPLDLDHIDGDHDNNTLSNLQILCPNCHSLKTRKQWKLNKKPKKFKECSKCSARISNHSISGHCKKCVERRPKIEWPSKKDLLRMIAESNYTQVAKNLNVSDNAIRRHLNKTP